LEWNTHFYAQQPPNFLLNSQGPDYDPEEEREGWNHSLSLPTLRLASTGNERKPLLSSALKKESPLKFTNWNWDEEGD